MDNNTKLIESLQDCVTACHYCAASCLEEENVESLTDCIRTDLDCADICEATAKLLVRESDQHLSLVELCRDICRQCAEECEHHDHEHCQQCAKACRRCEEHCSNYTRG